VSSLERARQEWPACGSALGAVLAALLFAFGCAHAPAPEASAPVERSAAQSGDTPGLFLYAVSAPGGRSYLLGTIHLGFGFEEVLTPAARRGFEESSRVWLEADVASADPQKLVSAALLPPDKSLRAIVGEPLWGELVAALEGQIQPEMLDRLEPWMPAMFVGLTRMGEVLQELKPGAGEERMDLELSQAAASAHKELHYLETVDEQIAIFDTIPVDEQVRELRHTLSAASGVEGRALLSAFASGDQAALEQALFKGGSMAEAPGFYAELLDRRNERWLPLLLPELDKGGAFIAVGAAHLLGEHGLLHTLAQRGYTIERVR
jgi:uncharacterized protein YbaP (TraB family)